MKKAMGAHPDATASDETRASGWPADPL